MSDSNYYYYSNYNKNVNTIKINLPYVKWHVQFAKQQPKLPLQSNKSIAVNANGGCLTKIKP